jgi:hypothetical protein
MVTNNVEIIEDQLKMIVLLISIIMRDEIDSFFDFKKKGCSFDRKFYSHQEQMRRKINVTTNRIEQTTIKMLYYDKMEKRGVVSKKR